MRASSGVFTLIGLYVGVIPVVIGLLWFPFLKRLSGARHGLSAGADVGLLVFLLVDGAQEGLEAAGLLPESFQGGGAVCDGRGRCLSAARGRRRVAAGRGRAADEG